MSLDSRSPETRSHEPESHEQPCPRCGGSGRIRLGDQRARTCLDCLGTGRVQVPVPAPRPTAVPAAAELLAIPRPRGPLSGSASSAAA